MKADVTVQMKDGRRLEHCITTRDALRDFCKRHKGEIDWLIADINLIRWFYSCEHGWFKRVKFRYVPNRPDLWNKIPVDELKFITEEADLWGYLWRNV